MSGEGSDRRRGQGALWLVLLGCVACQESAAPAPMSADSRRFVQDLQDGLAQGQRPDPFAVQRLKELGLAFPSDAAISKLQLQLLPAMRDWEGLARWFEAKGELDTEEQVALAKVYLNLADYEAAWRTIAPLAERRPEELEINALAGRAAFLRGDGSTAALHFDRVWPQMSAGGHSQEMSQRAILHLDAGELERARAVLEQALAQDEGSPYVHNALSRVLAAAGDAEGAERHERRTTELQAALSAEEQRLMRRAAQNQVLNEAWASGDFDRCHSLVLRFLVAADEEQAQALLAYLEGMYEAAGRADEAPAALEAARSMLPPSAPR